jgi:hypothetical protein
MFVVVSPHNSEKEGDKQNGCDECHATTLSSPAFSQVEVFPLSLHLICSHRKELSDVVLLR